MGIGSVEHPLNKVGLAILVLDGGIAVWAWWVFYATYSPNGHASGLSLVMFFLMAILFLVGIGLLGIQDE